MVYEKLEQKLTTAYRQVAALAQAQGISPRMAAYRLAVKRVAEAIRLRGIYP